MKTAKAINKAMAVFDRERRGSIRTVSLQEGSGNGNEWTQVLIRIEYAVNGDYTESDATPYLVNVTDTANGITAEKIN